MIDLDRTPIAYSYESAARAVGMSSAYIKKQVAAGRLGYFKVGTRVLIPHEELVAWLNSHTMVPAFRRD